MSIEARFLTVSTRHLRKDRRYHAVRESLRKTTDTNPSSINNLCSSSEYFDRIEQLHLYTSSTLSLAETQRSAQDATALLLDAKRVIWGHYHHQDIFRMFSGLSNDEYWASNPWIRMQRDEARYWLLAFRVHGNNKFLGEGLRRLLLVEHRGHTNDSFEKGMAMIECGQINRLLQPHLVARQLETYKEHIMPGAYLAIAHAVTHKDDAQLAQVLNIVIDEASNPVIKNDPEISVHRLAAKEQLHQRFGLQAPLIRMAHVVGQKFAQVMLSYYQDCWEKTRDGIDSSRLEFDAGLHD